MLTGYINVWSEQIENEEAELKDLRVVAKHLESPFDFMKGMQMENDAKSRADQR